MQEKHKFCILFFSRIKPILQKFSTILYNVLDTPLLSQDYFSQHYWCLFFLYFILQKYWKWTLFMPLSIVHNRYTWIQWKMNWPSAHCLVRVAVVKARQYCQLGHIEKQRMYFSKLGNITVYLPVLAALIMDNDMWKDGEKEVPSYLEVQPVS
jgi:hypothetical protein